MSHTKTFAGFGLGPVQTGLFLLEAFASGNFSRYVVGEVDSDLVRAVRENNGNISFNVARKDRIDTCTVENIEIYNPQDVSDREKLVDSVAESDEMATALPSIDYYDFDAATSVARIIADALSGRRASLPSIIYASENHNHAAEILRDAVGNYCPSHCLENVQILNTVIGKMGGAIDDEDTIVQLRLTPVVPEFKRAILVEEFNRILISRITLPGYHRGITIFEEKDDLLPFEEVKLYGHNAIHSLIAYLAEAAGLSTIAEAGRDEDIMTIARAAFINESGASLIQRHRLLNDPLFTQGGFREYADDLLERMINPYLNDLVSRVGRDHLRKLGYNDRFFGTMRIALENGIQPNNIALGAAACIASMIKHRDTLKKNIPHLPDTINALSHKALEKTLRSIWHDDTDESAVQLISLVFRAMNILKDKMIA